MSKYIIIEIQGNRVGVQDNGATLLEMFRGTNEFKLNLENILPKGQLTVDDKGNLLMVSFGTHSKKGAKPAIVRIEFDDDGYPCGGDVQHHDEDPHHVVRCLEFASSVYAKELVEIAERLFGKDEDKTAAWIEQIVNRPQ